MKTTRTTEPTRLPVDGGVFLPGRRGAFALSGALALALAACTEAPESDQMSQSERDQLNRGIVELAQELQDAELELADVRAELEAARAQIEELEGGEGPAAD